MNNRICELKEAAMEVTFSSPSTGREQKQLNVDKFAELIVRECARVIDRGDGAMCSLAETTWCNICRDDILNHFGVEE